MEFSIVIPTFNEEKNITNLLSDVEDACRSLPRFRLRDVVVLDGGSLDATVACVRQWSHTHPEFPVKIHENSRRLGKALELNTILSWDVPIVVGLDADIRLTPNSLLCLLDSLQSPDIAAVWGACLPPDGQPMMSRGSAFQMRLIYEIQRRLPKNRPIAQGFFWAIRLKAFQGFRWRGDLIAEDIQVAHWVEEHHLQCRQVPDAVVLRIPAQGFRDFYRQTYRYYVSINRQRLQNELERLSDQTKRPFEKYGMHFAEASVKVRALAATSLADPLGAFMFVALHIGARVKHVIHPEDFGPAWPTATSTKSQ
ncbi:MAG: glycosyltransferase [Firmicutes bacterium]|nr:glycosyltransferase [Bacillota bacterium]